MHENGTDLAVPVLRVNGYKIILPIFYLPMNVIPPIYGIKTSGMWIRPISS